MEVIECGSKGFFLDIAGTITAFEVRYKNIVYEFTYFYNGEFKSKWISEEQFDSNDGKTSTIGFIGFANGVEK